MAIVCSKNGQFFDVPDEELSKYAKKPEDLPPDVQGRSGDQGPDSGPGGQGGPGGMGGQGGTSPIQIIVNYIQGGGGGGATQGPPAGGKEKGKDDVGGRYCGWHNCWRNCWKNCWRNHSHGY